MCRHYVVQFQLWTTKLYQLSACSRDREHMQQVIDAEREREGQVLTTVETHTYKIRSEVYISSCLRGIWNCITKSWHLRNEKQL